MPHDNKSGRVEETHTLTQADFDRFARLSGDHNPIHVDPGFAVGTPFGATVSHGMLLFTALRGLIERHYPGARLEAQDLTFPAPAYANESLTLVLEPAEGAAVADAVDLITVVIKADGRRCVEGRCRLRPAHGETP